MIAKKKEMLTKMVNDFKSHTKVKKTYYAIVLAKLSRDSGTIKKNLLRIENAKNEAKVQVSEKGQTAISHYKKIREHCIKAPQGDIWVSEVEVQIQTGRMHQIRVHMKAL
jgi:23S rRNA-/tRNA-specific pseudouridylate synthase